MPKPRPITLTIDAYTADLLHKRLGPDAPAAIQQVIQYLLQNSEPQHKPDVQRGLGTPEFERDLVQMISRWVASGSVKTLEQASGKLLTYGTNYPIFHLWADIKKRAAKLALKQPNQ